MSFELKDYQEAAQAVRNRLPDGFSPVAAVILGSGLGGFSSRVEGAVTIPYTDIPHFPITTALSHKGELMAGCIAGQDVLLFSGRFHFYEGYGMDETAFPVRMLRLLDIPTLIITNAAGGICPDFSPGDLMVIRDHIKLAEGSPVRGAHLPCFGERFFDMSQAYDPDLRKMAHKTAASAGLHLQEGVYAYMTGPQYETPAEIRALSLLGADAVGMSTVPEVITAVQCGIRVLGISCITNMAAGVTAQRISGEDVVEVGRRTADAFASLVEGVIRLLK